MLVEHVTFSSVMDLLRNMVSMEYVIVYASGIYVRFYIQNVKTEQVNSEYIDTSTSSQYMDGQINCNSTENCTVQCDTFNGCRNADIFCPDNYSCLIRCIASSNSIDNNCREYVNMHFSPYSHKQR